MNKKSFALASFAAMSIAAGCTEDPNPQDNNMMTPRINNAPTRLDMDMGNPPKDMANLEDMQQDMKNQLDATMDMPDQGESQDMTPDLSNRVSLSIVCDSYESCTGKEAEILERAAQSTEEPVYILQHWGAFYVPFKQNVTLEKTDESPEVQSSFKTLDPNEEEITTQNILDRVSCVLPSSPDDFQAIDYNCTDDDCELKIKLNTLTQENSSDLAIQFNFICSAGDTAEPPTVDGVPASNLVDELFSVTLDLNQVYSIDAKGCYSDISNFSIIAKSCKAFASGVGEVYPDFREASVVFGKRL
jgi:hypothetical protein